VNNIFVSSVQEMTGAQTIIELEDSYSSASAQLNVIPRPARWSTEPGNMPEDHLKILRDYLKEKLSGAGDRSHEINILSRALVDFGTHIL